MSCAVVGKKFQDVKCSQELKQPVRGLVLFHAMSYFVASLDPWEQAHILQGSASAVCPPEAPSFIDDTGIAVSDFASAAPPAVWVRHLGVCALKP